MTLDPLTAGTVLPAPEGARVILDVTYDGDELGSLRLDAYLPRQRAGSRPCVLLVNGDSEEAVIANAKDWGVYRSYGHHLASRGMVAVPFNHRSTQRGTRTAAVAGQIAHALAYVRTHATDMEVDADRVGVWAFSAAGTFALAPLFRERPPHVRAVAGFYTVWDLTPPRDAPNPRSEAEIAKWSATTALADSAFGLPPIFVARAGRDSAGLKAGTDRFVERALQLDIDIRLHNHPTGQHGFDVRDDDRRSREIIEAALEFFVCALSK